jgi:hypothetical protein
MADTTTVATPPVVAPPPFSAPPSDPVVSPSAEATAAAAAQKTAADAETKAAAQVIRDKSAAKIAAKKTEPTDEEILFVAKAMDYDMVVDFDNPSRCANAKAEAKRMILGVRACARIGEAKKAETKPVVDASATKPVS